MISQRMKRLALNFLICDREGHFVSFLLDFLTMLFREEYHHKIIHLDRINILQLASLPHRSTDTDHDILKYHKMSFLLYFQKLNYSQISFQRIFFRIYDLPSPLEKSGVACLDSCELQPRSLISIGGMKTPTGHRDSAFSGLI